MTASDETTTFREREHGEESEPHQRGDPRVRDRLHQAVPGQDARRLAEIRYQGGATSYLEVLDADTRLFDAEIGLAQARLSDVSALVELYRALGGGWQP